MGHLEEKLFSGLIEKPTVYARYVDDIFLVCRDVTELLKLKESFEKNSVLKFTYELSNIKNQLAFLDVLVTKSEDRLTSSVYVKPTNEGSCLNGNSFCPEKYKHSVINNYLERSYKISESWSQFDLEVKRIKALLINNNYTNAMVDWCIKKFIDTKMTHIPSSRHSEPRRNKVELMYRAQMHDEYATDERILKDILDDNVKPKVSLHIYYENTKAGDLIVRNSTRSGSTLQRTNVVYRFTCPFHDIASETYIGHTRTTLSRRLTMHVQGGSIAAHFLRCNNMKVTKSILNNNTEVIDRDNDIHRLKIKEALHIKQQKPTINVQDDKFLRTLQLFDDGDGANGFKSNNETPPLPLVIIKPNNLSLPSPTINSYDFNLTKSPGDSGTTKKHPAILESIYPLPTCSVEKNVSDGQMFCDPLNCAPITRDHDSAVLSSSPLVSDLENRVLAADSSVVHHSTFNFDVRHCRSVSRLTADRQLRSSTEGFMLRRRFYTEGCTDLHDVIHRTSSSVVIKGGTTRSCGGTVVAFINNRHPSAIGVDDVSSDISRNGSHLPSCVILDGDCASTSRPTEVCMAIEDSGVPSDGGEVALFDDRETVFKHLIDNDNINTRRRR